MRAWLCLLLILVSATSFGQKVGSKRFTESYVLAEIVKRKAGEAGLTVEHKQGMGATGILWNALKSGSIDAYPEYTGTLLQELLEGHFDLEGAKEKLKSMGLGMTAELGFNNTYGIAMLDSIAQEKGITKLSDLAQHPELKAGITHELLSRQDGWPGLVSRYRLKLAEVRGMDHTLAYTALQAGQIDLTDCYTTDAEIQKYHLRVLEDDQSYFPAYRAVFLYRLSADPKLIEVLQSLGGTIDERKMIAMNAAATESKDFGAAAGLYFTPSAATKGIARQEAPLVSPKLGTLLLQHLQLVGVSLLIAVVVGVPSGIFASRGGSMGGFILGTAGVIQTVPSLALLALLVAIPWLGISMATAVIALFLYSLLPIVRNTATGLANIPGPLRESATALGLEPMARLRKVYLPMALPTILAGIKTSAVINVGTATLAALIGAGGLGEPIISGLAINDSRVILQGALPAAILAVVVQFAFDQIERSVVSRGLR